MSKTYAIDFKGSEIRGTVTLYEMKLIIPDSDAGMDPYEWRSSVPILIPKGERIVFQVFWRGLQSISSYNDPNGEPFDRIRYGLDEYKNPGLWIALGDGEWRKVA